MQALFEERDAVFSRFRPDSELNRVNARRQARRSSRRCSRAMVEAALWARETTGGLVDPTLGVALEAAGYDRDFAELRGARRAGSRCTARLGRRSSAGCSCSAAARSST